jgi:hypothetical protein
MKLCLNCLRNNHTTSDCRNTAKCRNCNKKHHSLLHIENNQTENPDQGDSSLTLNNHAYATIQDTVVLATAVVLIKNAKNEYKPCRLFLDSGSMSNCITRKMSAKLGLKPRNENFEIKGLNGTISTANQSDVIDIKSKYSSYQLTKIKCIVVDKITEHLPLVAINASGLEIPANIQLADPKFYESSEIDLLLGAALFWALLCIGQIVLPTGLVLQKTHFGFIAGGPYNNRGSNKNEPPINTTACNLSVAASLCNSTLEDKVCKFWKIENAGVGSHEEQMLSSEEIHCENHFKANTSRDLDGRFIIKLPIKNEKLDIGESKNLALKRFYNTERKFAKNPELKLEYSKFIQEYLQLKHMQLVKNLPDKNSIYLPHHAVLKESSTTTRLRVVFDASAKTTNNRSLNDNLMCGPTIQRDLFSIVVEFRKFQYALNADITKMYRQILIHPDDKYCQLILWRNNATEPVNTYALTTLTYGTKPASFIATRCLKELAEINSHKYPRACEIINNNFYMDDLLTGADSLAELIELRDQIIKILKQGQFELRKFQSNNITALPTNQNDEPNLTVQLNKNEQTKTLGLYWNPKLDTLNYDINLDDIPRKVTKRIILSVTSQIFDPLGLIGPVIMKAKIILQQLWALKLGWDEAVPMSIHSAWTSMLNKLTHVKNIQVPRLISSYPQGKVIELHGFCDASQLGYGAAIYLRTHNNDSNEYDIRLICAKSRVAPLKTITLPRLELCGALLLARLITKVKNNIALNFSRQFLWTDSSIVLAWINTPPNSLKTFVSNRISEIISLSSPQDWRHVRSENNAADILSRGAYPTEIMKNKMWFTGPPFLKNHESQWPQSNINVGQMEIAESRAPALICNLNVEIEFLKKFSQFKKLQRVTAWTLRFINNCTSQDKNLKPNLSTTELKTSTMTIVRLLQESEFQNEIVSLKNGKPLSNNSKLLPLNPFLDNFNIIRVGGRLKNANINTDIKYPILLPKNNFVTKLIIKHTHEQQLHAGRFSFFCGFGRSGRPMGSTNAWGCTIVTRTPRK